MMSKESKVFTDKLEALEYFAGDGEFYSASLADGSPVYVVAVSHHQATIALTQHILPLTKWDKATRQEQYVQALKQRVAKLEAAAKPAETPENSEVQSDVQETA
ncbi:MAG: hypothetical protein AAFV88_11615 [Planctomycetota bacterium]